MRTCKERDYVTGLSCISVPPSNTVGPQYVTCHWQWQFPWQHTWTLVWRHHWGRPRQRRSPILATRGHFWWHQFRDFLDKWCQRRTGLAACQRWQHWRTQWQHGEVYVTSQFHTASAGSHLTIVVLPCVCESVYIFSSQMVLILDAKCLGDHPYLLKEEAMLLYTLLEYEHRQVRIWIRC